MRKEHHQTMTATKKLLNTVPKILFFPILLIIMAIPQLLSESPSPFFRAVQSFLKPQIVFVTLVVILVALTLAFIVASLVDINRWRRKSNMNRKVDTTELVRRDRGGNGIYTAPIHFSWLFSILTYIYVESGKECAVIDGQYPVKEKRWYQKSFWHDATVRYVLLEPPPLTMLVENVHTKDNLYLASASISVTYRISNPVSVVKETDPIGVLQGHIRSQFTNLVGQLDYYTIAEGKATYETSIREDIEKLGNIPMFKIKSVHFEIRLEVDPENVKKLEELKRDQERKNLLIQDEQKERDHQREMEEKRLQAQLSIAGTIADIAKTRTESTSEFVQSVAGVLGVSRSSKTYDTESDPKLLPSYSTLPDSSEGSRFDKETKELDSLVQNNVIEDYEPRINKSGMFCGAVIRVEEGEIRILSPNYPDVAPTISVKLKSGQEYEWSIENWNPTSMSIALGIQIAHKKIRS